MDVDAKRQNEECVQEAIAKCREVGWRGMIHTIKMVHPRGRELFPTHGAIIIYGNPNDEHNQVYLVALSPNQIMPLHHHEDRKVVLRVICGNVAMFTMSGNEVIKEGEYITPRVGEKYSYCTNAGGAILVGMCKKYTNDYHWESVCDDQYTHISYQEVARPFDTIISETYAKYKQVNAKAINVDAIHLARNQIDALIPLYKEYKKVVDVRVVFKAIYAGRLEFLKWVLQSYGGCVFNYDMGLKLARKGGCIEVEEWLKNIFGSFH
jgi:quercetin dioxygenase-like cupin family protein